MIIKVVAIKYFLFLPLLCAAEIPQINQSLQTPAGENTPLIVDINGDGNKDLLVASENTGSLQVWFGNGELGLMQDKTYAVGDNPTSLAVADFNEDGRIDLIIANHERQYLSILLGESNGRFSEAKQVKVSVAPHPHVVATADINADGHMDVVIDSRDQSGLALLHGNGQGGFNNADKVISVKGLPYLGFALGDINNDGSTDVVTPNAQSIAVLSNSGSGHFIIEQSINMQEVFAVELIDMNGDSKLDLIAASSHGDVSLYFGQGDGSFNTNAANKVNLGDGAKLITTGDFDGNGYNDAVISSWNGSVSLLTYTNQKLKHHSLKTDKITAPWGLSSGDLNGDGIDEIVLADGVGKVLNIFARPN